MGGIEKFEDIEAWQEARELVKDIHRITREGRFSKDFILRDQVWRSAVSIMSNIAEGFARKSDKEFRQFMYISKASASELQSLFYVALDVGYISGELHKEFYRRIDSISRMLANFIKYLSKNI
ncbi:MAG: four helix bundle protein [Planctomycetota bacterium]|nr:MAG: four helix bundle protein [Planctomycetota bacterium]